MAWVDKFDNLTEISVDYTLPEKESSYKSPANILTPHHDESYAKTTSPEIPLTAFSCGESTLRVIVKYLRDKKKYDFSTIATLLNRNYQTIVATYNAFPSQVQMSDESAAIRIPVSLFSSRITAPLETLVSYLKSLGLSNAQISILIKRDQRTIWTAYHRKIIKEGGK
jgi:hypothetical protein